MTSEQQSELLEHIEMLERNVEKYRSEVTRRSPNPEYYSKHATAAAWAIEAIWLRAFLRRCQESEK